MKLKEISFSSFEASYLIHVWPYALSMNSREDRSVSVAKCICCVGRSTQVFDIIQSIEDLTTAVVIIQIEDWIRTRTVTVRIKH